MLQAVPIKFSCIPAATHRDFYVARAATVVACQGLPHITIRGFGCSRNALQAQVSALGEVHEHLWSHPTVLDPATLLSIQEFYSRTQKKIAAPDLYQRKVGRNEDATGAAFHFQLERCLEHSVLELLERHLIWRLWQEDLKVHTITCQEWQLIPDSVHCLVAEGLPFCLAICATDSFVGIGAKLSTSLESALNGAIAEAIMIHDDYSQLNFRAAVRHRETVLAMRDARCRIQVLDHVKKLPASQDEPDLTMSIEFDALAARLRGQAQEIWTATLPCPSGYCVKSHSNSLRHYKDPGRSGIPPIPCYEYH
ncbi:hypothetical protein EJP67_07705 [Variovorax guangxiensis]|uniref:YcaO domain-containing protein n=1 Tax=Variovorax guangxiensis TaxID=1775474 RepID=A0A3S0Z862_9BURK|nr:hypothetical protein [Variovorax guangxiensis]RUR66949.1 hypothetical protein EJP67_07705 [Variovorax guangxiensis]